MARRPAGNTAAGGSDDFSQILRLLELNERDGRWDQYLRRALSLRFQDDLADAAIRGAVIDAAGALGKLEGALDQAVRLRRVAAAAALTLGTARLTRRLASPAASGLTVPGADPAGENVSDTAEIELRTGRDVLRALVRAWESYAAGNPGAARTLLAAIVRASPPLIRVSDGDRWAVPLLRQARVIDGTVADYLLGLVDDNIRGDLARELTAAGEYGQARIAGTRMDLFLETKAEVLADLALAQAEAGARPGPPVAETDQRAVTETANLAVAAAQAALATGSAGAMKPRVIKVADQLAKAAAALTLSGADSLAARRWAEAMAAVEREPDPNRTLADFATAQVRAGLLDDAAQAIGVLLDDSQPSRPDWQGSVALDPAWQAATALVAAFAERREITRAVDTLRKIPDFAHSYPRAVRSLARAIAATDVPEAERLAGQVRDREERGQALAAVAATALAAGQALEAVAVAGRIESARWRAQALVDLAVAPEPAVGLPPGQVRDSIAAIADIETSAVLLAEYAAAQPDPGQRQRVLAEAVRLANQAPSEDRWRVLANIGGTVGQAGLHAEARETFTAALRLLARNPDEWDRELRQLCGVRFAVSDNAGALETALVAFGPPPRRRRARDRSRPDKPARDLAVDSAFLAAEAAQTVPIAVAALAAIATSPASATGDEPGAGPGQIERMLAAAERLATGLRGAGAIGAQESLIQAHTGLGDFAAAQTRILGQLPSDDDEDDLDADSDDLADEEPSEEVQLVAMLQKRSVALADALVAAGRPEQAARFMREIAQRLRPFAWSLGPGAPELLAELAAAQVRAADSEGARTTADFAATVDADLNGTFEFPKPFALTTPAESNAVEEVVDAVAAVMREAGVRPADFVAAGCRAIDYSRRPWESRARTLAAMALSKTDPAERAGLAELLAREQQQIWQLATVTFVRGATLDLADAAAALAALAVAQADIGESGGARRSAARARELAADLENPAERARALAGVAEGLSAIDDHQAALTLARRVDHPAYEGRAKASAITAAANASEPVGGIDLNGEAQAINDPGWRAVALVSVALAGAPPRDLSAAQAPIEQVPHGDPSVEVWREIIGRCLAVEEYDQATAFVDHITEDAGRYLAVLAVILGQRAAEGSRPAGDALLALLPRCARYPVAAYSASVALALAFPAEAPLIAGAVAQRAEADAQASLSGKPSR